jgi:uncharacterized membrane protein YoaK (UPF0700 family)
LKAHRGELADSCLLSLIAGYVDTCVFVGLFGLFTAHVTGNFVLIGSELVHRSSDVASKILALPVFIAAVMATVKAVEALQRAGQPRVAPVIFAEAGLLLACVVVALAFKAPASPSDPAALVAGLLATTAMGVQNAIMRLELSTLPSTTVMTMNVTQSAIDVVTMLSRRVDPATDAQQRAEARQRFTRMWPPIVAFTLGAAGGAGGYAEAGLPALIVPAIFCIVAGLHFSRRGRTNERAC